MIDESISNKIKKAKENNDLNSMERIYRKNRDNCTVKFDYAKLLLENNEILKAEKLLNSIINNKTIKQTYIVRNYSIFELARINIIKENYGEARICFESLVNTHNTNYACLELGKLEACDGNYDRAREIFNNLLFNKESEKFARQLLLLMEYRLGNYDVASKLVEEAIRKGFYVDPKIILSLGVNENIFFNLNYHKIKIGYTLGQIIEYSKKACIDHIREGHICSDEKTNFNDYIDINALYTDVSRRLFKQYQSTRLTFTDIYILPYMNIGTKGEDYIKVICLPDTKDIVAMYPIAGKYFLEDEEDESKMYVKK